MTRQLFFYKYADHSKKYQRITNMNLSIGKRFPDLELPDHKKERVKISDIAGKFPLVVIFYRGYW